MTSIRRHLTLTLLAGFGLLLAASGTAIYFLTRLALYDEFDNTLRAKALTIMSLTENDDEGFHVDLPAAYSSAAGGDLAPRWYELWQTNGTLLTRSASLKEAGLAMRFGTLAHPVFWNFDLPGDIDGRAIGLQFPVKTEEGEHPRGGLSDAVIVVAADRGTLDDTLAVLATVLITAGSFAITVTVPLVSFSLRRGHAPLGQLARQAAAINAESLATRFPTHSLPEELQPIAGRLNDLLSRLESSFERERRFSADLAHELRTPLAELRALAEVELAWPENEGAGKAGETLGIALQMEAMVTRLLELARCENGKLQLHLEPVHLGSLIAEVWQPLAAKAESRQLRLQTDVPPAAVLQTDRALLRAIVANLLVNTVDYTPPQGIITIRWDSDHSELTVSNTVQDLNSSDLAHLFERLWRKDQSRTGAEHCGLGLALSQAFARTLDLRLAARLLDEKTLAMTLRPQTRPRENPRSV